MLLSLLVPWISETSSLRTGFAAVPVVGLPHPDHLAQVAASARGFFLGSKTQNLVGVIGRVVGFSGLSSKSQILSV